MDSSKDDKIASVEMGAVETAENSGNEKLLTKDRSPSITTRFTVSATAAVESATTAANRAISVLTNDEESTIRLTTVKTVKGSGKIFVWRTIGVIFVSFATFIGIMSYFFWGQDLYSLVIQDGKLNNMCGDDYQEVYSIANVRESAVIMTSLYNMNANSGCYGAQDYVALIANLTVSGDSTFLESEIPQLCCRSSLLFNVLH
jgi:hypothetical protein